MASLLFVALIPFSTALVGDYLYDSLASIVLEVNLLVIGLPFYWHCSYASKNYRLLESGLSTVAISTRKGRSPVVSAVSIVAIILALFGMPWSTAIYFMVPILLMVIPSGRADERSNRSHVHGQTT